MGSSTSCPRPRPDLFEIKVKDTIFCPWAVHKVEESPCGPHPSEEEKNKGISKYVNKTCIAHNVSEGLAEFFCRMTNKSLYYNYRSVAKRSLIGRLPVTLNAWRGGAAVCSCSGVTWSRDPACVYGPLGPVLLNFVQPVLLLTSPWRQMVNFCLLKIPSRWTQVPIHGPFLSLIFCPICSELNLSSRLALMCIASCHSRVDTRGCSADFFCLLADQCGVGYHASMPLSQGPLFQTTCS